MGSQAPRARSAARGAARASTIRAMMRMATTATTATDGDGERRRLMERDHGGTGRLCRQSRPYRINSAEQVWRWHPRLYGWPNAAQEDLAALGYYGGRGQGTMFPDDGSGGLGQGSNTSATGPSPTGTGVTPGSIDEAVGPTSVSHTGTGPGPGPGPGPSPGIGVSVQGPDVFNSLDAQVVAAEQQAAAQAAIAGQVGPTLGQAGRGGAPSFQSTFPGAVVPSGPPPGISTGIQGGAISPGLSAIGFPSGQAFLAALIPRTSAPVSIRALLAAKATLASLAVKARAAAAAAAAMSRAIWEVPAPRRCWWPEPRL